MAFISCSLSLLRHFLLSLKPLISIQPDMNEWVNLFLTLNTRSTTKRSRHSRGRGTFMFHRASNAQNELRATKSGDEACAKMAQPSHKARPAVAGQLYSIVMRNSLHPPLITFNKEAVQKSSYRITQPFARSSSVCPRKSA